MSDQEFDRIESQLQRRNALGKVFKLAVYLSPLLPIGYCSYNTFAPDLLAEKFYLDDDQRGRLEAEVKRARESSRTKQARLQEALTKLGTLGPRPDLGGCVYQLRLREKYTKEGWQSPQHNSQFYLHKVMRGEQPALESAVAQSLSWSANHLDQTLKNGKYWKKKDGPRRWMYRQIPIRSSRTQEVVMVIDSRTDPQMLSDKFIAGHISGTAFLYDHGARKFVCAGQVQARNSESIAFKYYKQGVLDTTSEYASGQHALERDLAIELERAIARSMKHAVGPKEPAATTATDEPPQ